MPFDPDAAAQPGSGVFGLPFSQEQASLILIPVPFDATTSYGGGTSAGPEAVFNASMQVDLFDHQFGRVYEQGLFMDEISGDIQKLSAEARRLARPIIERGGAGDEDAVDVATINRAGDVINSLTFNRGVEVLAAGKVPGLLGGDHSTPFGLIRACAEHIGASDSTGLGILQVDAHMDFRDAFEGFAWSHASIMHNVLNRIPAVTRLVQVGIRDYGQSELEFGKAQGDRVATHFDFDWTRRMDDGERWDSLCRAAIEPLPRNVYISFDIDGLDPSLCPHTGTPVAGGLGFNRACRLLEVLARSGRRVVGFDLNEVSPGLSPDADEPEWDANVGARMLYKLCGAAAVSRA